MLCATPSHIRQRNPQLEGLSGALRPHLAATQASLPPKRSLVQSQYRPPDYPQLFEYLIDNLGNDSGDCRPADWRCAWARLLSAGQWSYRGGIVCLMPRGNPSPKLAITVDPDVHAEVVEAAAAEGVSVSAWMTAAARRALRVRSGLAAVAEWEADNGPLTAEELDAARRRAGITTAQRQTA
jgi:hypothetical protein